METFNEQVWNCSVGKGIIREEEPQGREKVPSCHTALSLSKDGIPSRPQRATTLNKEWIPLHQIGDSNDLGFDTVPRQGETPDARFDSLKNSPFRVKLKRITSLHSRQNNGSRRCCGKRKDLCWTESLRAMNSGVPTLTGSLEASRTTYFRGVKLISSSTGFLQPRLTAISLKFAVNMPVRTAQRDIRIEERRARPRKPSQKTKVLRETVQVQHNSDVHELAPRLERYDSTGSRHSAQIERKELSHALIWCCGKRKDLCWTESLRAMNSGAPTLTGSLEASRMTSTHHQMCACSDLLSGWVLSDYHGPLLHFNGECCPSEDLWKGSIAGKGLRPPVVAASGKDITKYEAQVDAEAAAAYGNYPEPANDGILRWESQRKRRFERRAGPRKSSLKSKVLRETVQVHHNSDVHELAPRLERYDSTGSRHSAQIERKELSHALIWCCGKRKDLCWTESLRAMNSGVPTLTGSLEASRTTCKHHQMCACSDLLSGWVLSDYHGPLLHFNGECCPSEDLWKGSIAGKGLRPPVVAASGKDITGHMVTFENMKPKWMRKLPLPMESMRNPRTMRWKDGKVNAKEDSKNESGCAKAKVLEWSMRVNGPPMVNFEKKERPVAEKRKTSNGVRKRIDNRMMTVPYIRPWFPSFFCDPDL
ncbi:hypothetical protein M514_20674 [Trichuris suis]|uniref:Uncharacterized protein n=1 Tax=Trichuris suis TaxID=68888 RepID=A0A085NC58_9BILA|nr:hypothetical protein M514_20674 [Trichuris suis]